MNNSDFGFDFHGLAARTKDKVQGLVERERRAEAQASAGGGSEWVASAARAPQNPAMSNSTGDPATKPVDPERLAKLEGQFDGYRYIPPVLIAVAAIGVAFLIYQFNSFSGRIAAMEMKVDGVSRQLTEEFRAMRSEMAAQTSAIANSITATRQVQPQIVVVPTPVPVQPPTQPPNP